MLLLKSKWIYDCADAKTIASLKKNSKQQMEKEWKIK